MNSYDVRQGKVRVISQLVARLLTLDGDISGGQFARAVQEVAEMEYPVRKEARRAFLEEIQKGVEEAYGNLLDPEDKVVYDRMCQAIRDGDDERARIIAEAQRSVSDEQVAASNA